MKDDVQVSVLNNSRRGIYAVVLSRKNGGERFVIPIDDVPWVTVAMGSFHADKQRERAPITPSP